MIVYDDSMLSQISNGVFSNVLGPGQEVEQWLEPLPHSTAVLGLNAPSGQGLCVWSLQGERAHMQPKEMLLGVTACLCPMAADVGSSLPVTANRICRSLSPLS